jgi:protein SCO1
MKRILTALLGLSCLISAACQAGKTTPERRYALEGTVVGVDKQGRHATIAHKEVPGYMAAMTMPFSIKDEWALSVLEPGRYVRATLVVADERSWLEEISVTEPSTGGPGDALIAASPDPVPGVEVPDFRFVNQDGRALHLGQYRGQALVITFIYTRCPLPDYCPRMSRNLSEIHAVIMADPSLQSATHLLCISFDPQFDTPEVLRRYGAGYAGRADREPFRRWEFVTGSAEEVKKAAGFFGVSYSQDSGQIVHSLRTALVGPDGKLVRIFRGNDWRPGEIVAELKTLLQRGTVTSVPQKSKSK